MRAVITGVAGFVGSNLADELLSQGHEVVGIDSITDYYSPELKRANLARLSRPGFTFLESDLNDLNLIEVLDDSVDVVYHQAGQPGVRKSWGSDFDEYVHANISATQKLLEAAVHCRGLSRLVYASSSSVYGNAETYPTSEQDRPQPMSPYGVTKLAAEHLCSLYAENFGLPTTSLRYFTVYGPGQRPDMAFTRFTTAAVRGEPITVFGSGEQLRDFTFIDDVVRANIAAGAADVKPGTVLNVAGGSNVSVNEALSIIEELHGSSLEVRREGTVRGDVFRTGGSTDAIRANLGWEPQIGIVEGLRRHYEWACATNAGN